MPRKRFPVQHLIEYSPNGRYCASASKDGDIVYVWSILETEVPVVCSVLRSTIKCGSRIKCLVWSRDNLLTIFADCAFILDEHLSQPTKPAELILESKEPASQQGSSEGKRSADREVQKDKYVSQEESREAQTEAKSNECQEHIKACFKCPSTPFAAAWHDNYLVYAATSGFLNIYDDTKQNCIFTKKIDKQIKSLDILNDTILACINDCAVILDCSTGTLIEKIDIKGVEQAFWLHDGILAQISHEKQKELVFLTKEGNYQIGCNMRDDSVISLSPNRQMLLVQQLGRFDFEVYDVHTRTIEKNKTCLAKLYENNHWQAHSIYTIKWYTNNLLSSISLMHDREYYKTIFKYSTHIIYYHIGKERTAFKDVLCLGIQPNNSNWSNWLIKGIYDPRLVLLIGQFAFQKELRCIFHGVIHHAAP